MCLSALESKTHALGVQLNKFETSMGFHREMDLKLMVKKSSLHMKLGKLNADWHHIASYYRMGRIDNLVVGGVK